MHDIEKAESCHLQGITITFILILHGEESSNSRTRYKAIFRTTLSQTPFSAKCCTVHDNDKISLLLHSSIIFRALVKPPCQSLPIPAGQKKWPPPFVTACREPVASLLRACCKPLASRHSRTRQVPDSKKAPRATTELSTCVFAKPEKFAAVRVLQCPMPYDRRYTAA